MNICDFCGKPVTAEQSSVEHITPLSRGGKNIKTNMRIVHIWCHRKKPTLWQRIKKVIEQIKCSLGMHKWRPKNNNFHLDWRSKWEAYEVAEGVCDRCKAEAEIRRDYYW